MNEVMICLFFYCFLKVFLIYYFYLKINIKNKNIYFLQKQMYTLSV